MDYDRLALFLAGYTTGGFRRSLRTMPQLTLTKCGFNAAEAAQLAASLAKHGSDTHDILKVQFAYRQISWNDNSGSKSTMDDWSSRC